MKYLASIGKVTCRLRVALLLVSLSAAILSFATSLQASQLSVHASPQGDEYVYYGYVPSRIYVNWSMRGITGAGIPVEGLEEASIRDYGLLVVVGCQDATNVQVLRLPGGASIQAFTLNRLEKQVLKLANASFFKVVADKPVTVMLAGGRDVEVGAHVNTFYTGVRGGYLDKEFIFGAVAENVGTPYKIIALEDSDVAITDANGSNLESFKLQANQVREYAFANLAVYRIQSSGYLMLQSIDSGIDHASEVYRPGSTFYPSVQGGFVGTLFYGSTDQTAYGTDAMIYRGSNRSFIATSVEEAKVGLVQLQSKRKVAEHQASSATAFAFRWADTTVGMAVTATKPILLAYRDNDVVDGGLAYLGLKADQEAYLDVPIGETYLFAYTDTVVMVDDVRTRLGPDGILELTRGIRKISASENVIIEVVNLADRQGLRAFGDTAPSVQSLDLTYEDLRLKPLLEEETAPWTYIAAGAVVVVVAVVAIRLRRPRSQPSR